MGGAASLGYGLLFAVVLPPEAMGEFTIALSVSIIAATLSKFGLDAYLMRHAAGNPQQALGLTMRCLGAAGLVGVLAWVLCFQVGVGILSVSATSFGVLLLGIPFLSMAYVLTGLLKAGDLPAAAIFLETGAWQSVMCACAVLMLFAGYDSVFLIAVCFAAGAALVLAGYLYLAWRLMFRGGSFAQRAVRPSDSGLREVASLAGVSAGNVCMRWSDTLWIAWWLEPADVAVYVVCTRLAGGIAIIDSAVNAVAAPRFARHHERGETRGLQRAFLRACAISGIWGALGAAALMLLAPFVLGWLGPPYADAVAIVRLAAVAMAVQVALVPAGHLAAMSGRAADHFKAVTVALAIQQIAFLLLIPVFGMVAALLGFALSRTLAFLLTLALLRHQRDFDWLPR